jgi:hypothetical protein
VDNNITAQLPAGLEGANRTLIIAVDVYDSLGARAVATVTVRVLPFVPPENVDMSAAAESMMDDLAASGDTEAVGQVGAPARRL